MRSAYEVAQSYMGLEEYPGAANNPAVLKMFADSGHDWVDADSTPWCAAFVGSVLAQTGVQGTGKLNARSYLNWGKPVDLGAAEPGDVVVFWRGSRDGWQGHVGFYAGVQGNNVVVLGGNQGDKVSKAEYPISRLLGVRRVKEPRSTPAQSTTVQASAAQAVAAATGGVTAVAALDGQAQIIALVCAAVVGLAAVWIMRERLKKWAMGDR